MLFVIIMLCTHPTVMAVLIDLELLLDRNLVFSYRHIKSIRTSERMMKSVAAV